MSQLEWEMMSWSGQHIQVAMTHPEGRNVRLESKASEDTAVMGMG